MATVVRKRNVSGDDVDGDIVNGDVSPRKLRRGKERRVYTEDLLDHDTISYIDGQRSFDILGMIEARGRDVDFRMVEMCTNVLPAILISSIKQLKQPVVFISFSTLLIHGRESEVRWKIRRVVRGIFARTRLHRGLFPKRTL